MITAEPSRLKLRRGPGIRRGAYVKSAEEGEMTREQFFLLMAVQQRKSFLGQGHLTMEQFFDLCRCLGYERVSQKHGRLIRLAAENGAGLKAFSDAVWIYRQLNHRRSPRFTELLWILRRSGYRKIRFSSIAVSTAEDWLETGLAED